MAPVPPATKIRIRSRLRVPPMRAVRRGPRPLAGWRGERAQRLPRGASGVVPGPGRRPGPALVGRLRLDASPPCCPQLAAAAALGRGRPAAGTARHRWRRGRWRRSASPPSPRARSVDDELRMVPVARVAVAMPAVYYLVNLVVAAGRTRTSCAPPATSCASTGTTRRHGITPPPYHGPSGLSPSASSSAWSRSPRSIVACVWQHRAASAGRAPRHPVAPFAGVGRRLVVRAGRQPVGALLRHP